MYAKLRHVKSSLTWRNLFFPFRKMFFFCFFVYLFFFLVKNNNGREWPKDKLIHEIFWTFFIYFVKMAESSKNIVREATFIKWHFVSYFSYEVEDGIIISVNVNSVLKPSITNYFAKQTSRFKRTSSYSLESYWNNIIYIHHKTLKQHVRQNSFHNWCKNVTDPLVAATSNLSFEPSSSKNLREQDDDMLIGTSFEYYKKLFSTILIFADEELASLKLKALMVMQMRNGLKLGSLVKVNDMTYSEMIDVLAEVVMDHMRDFVGKKWIIWCLVQMPVRQRRHQKNKS